MGNTTNMENPQLGIIEYDAPHPVSEPVLVNLGDIHPEHALRVACETAYRRGFTQGVAATMRAVESKATNDKINHWYDRLMEWRYTRHDGKPEFPEEIA